MTKRKISVGKQTDRFLQDRLKPLGFKYAKGRGLIANIDGIKFTVRLAGPSWPGSCIRSVSLSFSWDGYVDLLKEIYGSYILDFSAYNLEMSVMQMFDLLPSGAIDVGEFDISSAEDAKNAANTIAECLNRYAFARPYAFKNIYFTDYIMNVRGVMGTSNDNALPRKYLSAKLVDEKKAENIESEMKAKLKSQKIVPSQSLYKHANGFMHYLRPFSRYDLWQKIGLEDTLDLKIEACSLFLIELKVWLAANKLEFSEVRKLLSYIQNNKVINHTGFEKHFSSLGRQLYDHQVGAIPSTLMERIEFLWEEIKFDESS